jgi:3-dehydroquinate synthase
MKQIRVNLGTGSYDVCVGKGEAKQLPHLMSRFSFDQVVVVTDQQIWQSVQTNVDTINWPIEFVPWGDDSKNQAIYFKLSKRLFKLGVTRASILVGLGGGAIGDLTGFIAATYMRGIRYINVPTTLLAQVDSSVGGKTGINLGNYKNILGCFHQPSLIVTDLLLLRYLPKPELASGLGEIVKYGVLNDEILKLLESKQDLFDLDYDEIIGKCIETKAKLVEADEFDKGERAFLNLGHTIAHAIERMLSLRHGEAVSIGLANSLRISVSLNLMSKQDSARIIQLLSRCELPTDLPKIELNKLIDNMRFDKKNQKNMIRLVLAQGLRKQPLLKDFTKQQIFDIMRGLL